MNPNPASPYNGDNGPVVFPSPGIEFLEAISSTGPGEMALCWTVVGLLEAERQLRKIIGYRDLATLVVATERDHDYRCAPHTTSKEAAIVLSA